MQHRIVGAEEIQRRLQLSEVADQGDKLGDILSANRDLVSGNSDEQGSSQREDGALREIQAVQRPHHKTLRFLKGHHVTLEAFRLRHNSTIVLHCLIGHNSVGLDGIHLTTLGDHVSALSSSVLGHIYGQKDVGPHDEEDDDGIERIILDEEYNASHEDVK